MTDRPRQRLSRRALVAGASGILVGGLEYASLRGGFDHWRPATRSAGERFDASRKVVEAGRAGVVHVAHSTHLIGLGGRLFLTDPWFYDPAFGALSHDVLPAVLPEELGALDAILITHDHADHADLRALDRMDKRAIAIVATRELEARIRQRGFADTCVLAPWEERSLGPVTVTAVPALHDVYEVGFVLRGPDRSVYFAGDSALHPDLAAIAERFRPDVSLLPVDGTRLTGGGLHVMTPDDAVTAARTLGSKRVMPSHAEAKFSDPLVDVGLASMVPDAQRRFSSLVARELPGVVCEVPQPGALVLL